MLCHWQYPRVSLCLLIKSPSEHLAYIPRGEPGGILVRIDGKIDAYLAKPSSKIPRQGILYIPDIVGIWQNSKLMADAFAAQGYVCLVVDIFNGDPAPLNMPDGFDIMKWLTEGSDGHNPHTPDAIDPIVQSSIAYLKSIGITQIGAAGYCLGAKVRFRHRINLAAFTNKDDIVRRSPLQERY